MDYDKLIDAVKLCGSTTKIDQCKQCAYWSGGDMSKCIPRMTTAAATALSTLQEENEKLRSEAEGMRLNWYKSVEEIQKLREQVRQLETRARTERCDTADYDCRELGALRREVSSLRERLAAGGWIDPAVELPPNDDMVLAIVSGKPADNITLKDAYELASYGSEGWIVEQYELWETPTVSWWRPLPDPPEKKKEER